MQWPLVHYFFTASATPVARRVGALALAFCLLLGDADGCWAARRNSPGPQRGPDQLRPTTAGTPDPQTRPYSVAVLGDGFAEALAEGLSLNAAGQSGTTILQKTHAPYGLSQDDRFEWPIAIRNMFAASEPIDAAVIMMGANDTMPIKDGVTIVEPQTPRWRQMYGARVDAVVALFRDKGIPVIWVGLPIVQDDELSAQFVALNEIVRDRTVKAGATYVDSWEAFVDDAGKYAASGPDLNGQPAKLRASDGIDFTRAGERKLASFVEADLRRDREKAKPDAPNVSAVVIPTQPGFDNALQIDVNAQIRREAGLPALPSSDPAPQGATGVPQIGPIISLTAPVVTIGGRLADATSGLPRSADRDADGLTERALVQGQPIQPKPSRMDDFSWPRQ
ncbi:DUF459 domain-containing protein [Lichenihabitans sp. PAMC28606]|uniref:SGNH/GDSL hydrolase family protein n=1 Tax=Lichenihabitans sp. PAMC28606 TaxID=2880932 RepID=UPI001D0A7269|nr:DUF459 domain-containing protein [Lichenihabitans sp. PAMC28606]UDL96375.1 DUF459 domain-containing protein [Lichenihabitans sp. PAMC28606]